MHGEQTEHTAVLKELRLEDRNALQNSLPRYFDKDRLTLGGLYWLRKNCQPSLVLRQKQYSVRKSDSEVEFPLRVTRGREFDTARAIAASNIRRKYR